MSSFQEKFASSTFAIPGFPGYYYRPLDGAVISNKNFNKHTIGKQLTIYSNKEGEKFVKLLDCNNCRRKLTIFEIEVLLNDEIRRVNEVRNNLQHRVEYHNNYVSEQQQIEEYIRMREQRSFGNIRYMPPIQRGIQIDSQGNVKLPPVIVFIE